MSAHLRRVATKPVQTPIKINHPRRRGIVGYAVRVLKRREHYAKSFMFPDVFFNWVFSKKVGKELFSKKSLYEAIEGKVRRPNSTFVRFRPKEKLVRKATRNDYDVNALANKLEKEGSVFLKPVGILASEGWNIARIQKKRNSLVITVSEDSPFKLLAKTLPLGSFRIAGDKKIEIPLSRRKSLRSALREITSTIFEFSSIAESEIRMPLYEGRKWEIRTIVQSPDRKPVVVGHFAKLGGKTSIVANVAKGGRGEESSKVILGLYKKLYPHKSKAEIGILTSEFFRRANTEAEKAVRAVNEYIQRLAEKYIVGFPKSELYARQAAVDITGEVNPITGKIDPVVGEIQYPNFGTRPEFENFDPLGCSRFKKNYEKMAIKGKRVLMKAFGLAR